MSASPWLRWSLLSVFCLGGGISAWADIPDSSTIFGFSLDWGEEGHLAADLIALLGGQNPTPTTTPQVTATLTSTSIPSNSPTRTITNTSSPTTTPTPTHTLSGGPTPVISSVVPSVVQVGAPVTVHGAGFGIGAVQVDVGGTLVIGAASDSTVQFTMPSVAGMTLNIHCVEIRVLVPGKAVSSAGGVVYPPRYEQGNGLAAIVTDATYVPSTRRFQIDVAVENSQTAGGKPQAVSSPVAIIRDVTGSFVAGGVGTDNDTGNPFISSLPHWDYRFVEPVVTSPGHRLESGETTESRTWIIAADSPSTHAFSLETILAFLAQPKNAHSADISSTSDYPHPYGLGFDPVTRLIHVSGDPEGWMYAVNVDSIEETVASQLNLGEGPSFIEVSPAGSDPVEPQGRIWWSWTHPNLLNTHNVVGSWLAAEFLPSGAIGGVTQTYKPSPTGGLSLTEPRGLAYDPAVSRLYIGAMTRVVAIEIDGTPSAFFVPGFLDVRGVAVDPGTGDVFIVQNANDTFTRLAGIRTSTTIQTFIVGGHGNQPAKFNDPQGIDVDEDGLVYVVDRGNDRIQVFDGRDPNLRWLMMFGGHVEAASLPGCEGPNSICPQAPADGFNHPFDAETTDTNSVWVSDPMNGRIVKWEHDSFGSDVPLYASP